MTKRLLALSLIVLGLSGCATGGSTPSPTRSTTIWIQNKSQTVLRVMPYEAGVGENDLRNTEAAPIVVSPGQTVTQELRFAPDARLAKGEAPAALQITARRVSDSAFKGTWVVQERAGAFRVVAVQDQIGSVHLFWGSENGDELMVE